MTFSKCSNKFWINNITNLFCDYSIIPLNNMSLESKLNAVTRFVFLLFIVFILFFNIQSCLLFLFLSLFIIIIYYFIKNKDNSKMNKEHFVNPPQRFSAGPNGYAAKNRGIVDVNKETGIETLIYDRPTNFVFCNDEVPYEPNNTKYMSINQKLVGAPNPKTLIPPVIVPPIADLSYWKTNNLVTHSSINDMKQIDTYQSGYQVTTCCGDGNICDAPPTKQCNSGYKSNKGSNRYSKISNENNNNNYIANKIFGTRKDFQVEENYQNPNMLPEITEIHEIIPKPNQPGQVNVQCGYYPEQVEVGLPTNLSVGNCQRDQKMKRYNENIFTQTIQPGVYTVNQVNEPINSNIGISFDQQFEPLTKKVNRNGDILFTQHDPRIFEPEVIEPIEETINESNVYDPRFSGYGTSYRSYTDDNIGQTRFYYDDVNAIRMPNYIVRSKIDFIPDADHYGPMKSEYGNDYNAEIRKIAQNKWNNDSMDFRTDLQERLMRKINADAWQQRVAPISTSGQRMLTAGRR
jgi:Ca2+/Na+ antiporter